MKVTVDVKKQECPDTKRRKELAEVIRDKVAEGMMEVHTENATSTPVMETSKALKQIFTQGPSFTTAK
jgi:hypothetical protein